VAVGQHSEYRAGFDIGGTFTDAVLVEAQSGRRYIAKTLTTPRDPAVGAMRALREILGSAEVDLDELAVAIHGMTLVSNALLQRHGARTALITTRGFKDVLEIARELRYDIYRLTAPFPEPLVPRRYRYEVPERTLASGQVYEPLDTAAAIEVLETIEREGIEAIAVCFLHSYRNPAHELAMGNLIQERLPAVPFSLSSQVVAEFREYERTSTTAANAYTQPLVAAYLARLEEDLREGGFREQFSVMMSTGGITPAATAARFPIRLVESGPAAGALATGYFSSHIGEDHLLSFDMGGTTAKSCIIDQGVPTRTKYFEVARVERFTKGSGLPIRAPVIDMIEIGAGGGSIAFVDQLGLLRVGPESAEADPGPACYGLGGARPTVTDANLALGYLNPDYFLGGAMQIRPDLAEAAIQRHVAEPLGLSLTEAAWGIFQVVSESMASAARVHFAEKGRDPRRYALFAYGGGGPLHAAIVARRLRITRVIVPFGAGVLAAFGFLTAPASFDFIRTYITRLDHANWPELNAVYEEMEARGREVLHGAHVPDGEQRFVRSADMRYAGQLYEITVPVPAGPLSEASRAQMEEYFNSTYAGIYGMQMSEAPIEALNWRLLATGPRPTIPLETAGERPDATLDTALKGTRRAFFGDHGGWVDARVYDRYSLPEGVPGIGPALVEERESTLLVPPGDEFVVDRYRNLRLALRD
jgi:N-methylhydantoinase A/oxoprolinase/acetone carboxylase beta subunit